MKRWPVAILFFLATVLLVCAQETQNPTGAQEPQAPPAAQTPPQPSDTGQQAQGTEGRTQSEPQVNEPPSAPEPQSPPHFEVFGGYSYAGADPYTTNQRTGLNGWEAALDINLARWLRLVLDFSGDYGNVNVPVLVPEPFPPCTPLCPSGVTTFPANTHVLSYLFGVDIPYRRWNRVVPYGQALFGRSHVNGNAVGIGLPGGSTVSDTKFAMALGGGFDYNISRRFAWRVQGDYWQTKFFTNTQDNYRLSTGVVIRLIRKKKKRTLVTP